MGADEPGRFRQALRQLLKSRTATFGLAVVLAFLLVALFAPLLTPHPPDAQLPGKHLAPSGGEHLLGTDDLGRDLLSRLIAGARVSLRVAVMSVAISLVCGVALGATAGWFGGWWDQLTMRAIDVLMAFPSVLLAVAVVAILGPSLTNVMISVGIVGIPVFTRQVRAEVLRLRSADYVLASRALGAGSAWLLIRVVLPNSLGPIIVLATLGTGSAILDSAGLNFLGLGAETGTPEWGMMLKESQEHFFSAPRVVIAPGLAIALVVLGFNLLGDGLRDLLDPKGRHRR